MQQTLCYVKCTAAPALHHMSGNECSLCYAWCHLHLRQLGSHHLVGKVQLVGCCSLILCLCGSQQTSSSCMC